MNQILSTEMPRDNNSYNDYRKSRNNAPNNLKKAIIIFAVLLIIIGIIILGMIFIKSNKEREEQNKVENAQVLIEEVEESNKIRITATYELGINEIEYYFNEDDITNIQANGKTSIEKLIDKPSNALKLTVKLTDINGQESEFTKEFDVVDSNRPTIMADVVTIDSETKLKIVAQDDIAISYLTYQWTDGEEVRIDTTEETQTLIETEISIERATKDITITAVDIYGNKETLTKTIVGKYIPEISVIQYGDKLECKVSHDMGFEKIIFNINGQEMVYDDTKTVYDPELTEFVCSIPLKSGENKIIIQAYSREGTEKTYKGICTSSEI